MTTIELTIIALSVEAILYLLLITVTLTRGGQREATGRVLLLYAAVSGLWVLLQLAVRMGWLDLLNPYGLSPARLPLYGLVLLALLFLLLTRSFLRLPGAGWGWAVLGIAWIAGLLLLDSGALALPDTIWATGGWSIGPAELVFAVAVAGWGLFMAASAWLTARIYRRTELPLHRNRLKYWIPTWGITLAGDVLFLAGYQVIGGDLRFLGTLVAAYLVLTHRLPDVRQMVRRAVSYLVITLLTVVIYTAGFTAVQYLFQGVPGYSPLWAGAVVALILAILFDPLLGLVQKLVNRLLAGTGYDPGRTVSEYGQRISNIVSLERLATLMVSLIGETLQTQRGMLFVVNYEKDEDGTATYQLRGIEDARETPPSGVLSVDSPVTHHLRETRQPLTQYDVDLLPALQKLPAAERDWLSDLGMDVYVPIHSQDSWRWGPRPPATATLTRTWPCSVRWPIRPPSPWRTPAWCRT
jgi:hypothetical protein